MYLYIAIVSILLYLLLQYLDDQRNLRLHKAPSSMGTKLAMFFFSFVITTVGFHFFWNGSSKTNFELEGGDYVGAENNHLKHIHQEVEVGLPDF
jgi:hypothetical protein